MFFLMSVVKGDYREAWGEKSRGRWYPSFPESVVYFPHEVKMTFGKVIGSVDITPVVVVLIPVIHWKISPPG